MCRDIETGATVSSAHAPDLTALLPIDPTTVLSPPPVNLTDLHDICEPAVLNAVRRRYAAGDIYTAVHDITLSVNPYRLLPIYSDAFIRTYAAASIDDLTLRRVPPHVFGVAAAAYRSLMSSGSNQAIIISGESGAGKSEATKQILQFLSTVAGDTAAHVNSRSVCDELLHTAPLLEAFGNAKTVRNDNSSRFGKFMEIFFDEGNGHIAAAKIVNFLLEKSRLTSVAAGERNYHIFYQMCAGMSAADKTKYSVGGAADYKLTAMSGQTDIGGFDDATQFEQTRRAMAALNFTQDETCFIWRTLSALLHLSNVDVVACRVGGSDGSNISPSSVARIDIVSGQLGIAATDMSRALCYRRVVICNETNLIPLNPNEARDVRDAMIRAIYNKMFDWIINKINAQLMSDMSAGEMSKRRSIGILDIFGFENFTSNGFEQFCINWTNEKLQNHFNAHCFFTQMKLYSAQQIPTDGCKFVDNGECVCCIEQKPGGIVSLMDDEVNVPGGSDDGFMQKLIKTLFDDRRSRNKSFDVIRKKPDVFIVKHFAAPVEYNVKGFINKNRDKLHEFAEETIKRSSEPILQKLFASSAPATNQRGRRVVTVVGAFEVELNDLMSKLSACSPHFIRCIKPNNAKQPNDFNAAVVHCQLAHTGMYHAIQLKHSNFAHQMEYAAFNKEYAPLTRDDQQTLSEVQRCKHILRQLVGAVADSDDVAFGLSIVFMRKSVRTALSDVRRRFVSSAALTVQCFWRTNIARRHTKHMRLVEARGRALLSSQNADDIQSFLDECERANIIVPSVGLLLSKSAALAEWTDLSKLMSTALQRQPPSLNEMNAAIAAYDKFRAKHRAADLTTNKTAQLAIDNLRRARDDLTARERIRSQLRRALDSGDADELNSLLPNAALLLTTDDDTRLIGRANDVIALRRKTNQVSAELSRQMNAPIPTSIAPLIAVIAVFNTTLADALSQDIQSATIDTATARLLTMCERLMSLAVESGRNDVIANTIIPIAAQHEFTAIAQRGRDVIQSAAQKANAPTPSRSPPPLPPPLPLRSAALRNRAFDAELQRAIDNESISEVSAALSKCADAGHKSATVTSAQHKLLTMQNIQTFTNALQSLIDQHDVDALRSALAHPIADQCRTHQTVQTANAIVFELNDAERCDQRIQRAIATNNFDIVSALLNEAAAAGYESQTINEARNKLSAQTRDADWKEYERSRHSTTAAAESPAGLSALRATLLESYGAFIRLGNALPNGVSPLTTATHIRRSGNYAKRHYLSKRLLKDTMLVWQRNDMPRTLISIDRKIFPVAASADRKAIRLAKETAVTVFRNIRGYMGDCYHPYPVVLAYDVVKSGCEQPLLRDEIVSELIKQTSGNTSAASRKRGFQLLFLCLSTFKCSALLTSAILTHLAQFAHRQCPFDPVSFDDETDIATNCFLAFSAVIRDGEYRDDTAVTVMPTIEDIRQMTDGTLLDRHAAPAAAPLSPTLASAGAPSTMSPATISAITRASLTENAAQTTPMIMTRRVAQTREDADDVDDIPPPPPPSQRQDASVI